MAVRKSARVIKAEQVWIDYNALDEQGRHSLARAEFAMAKIANGTAPLTPEAVDLMAAEVARRVERREAAEREYAERQQYFAEVDEQRRQDAAARRMEELGDLRRAGVAMATGRAPTASVDRSPLVLDEDAFLRGAQWSPEQVDKMSAMAQASAADLVNSISPADLIAESLEEHEDAFARWSAVAVTAMEVGERLAIADQTATLIRTYFSPFSVDKGPALLSLAGDDIPSPARILEVIRGYITGEPS